MKSTIERRKPQGGADYLALALTTVGVGYFPVAPGTLGSAVGVAVYLGAESAIYAVASLCCTGNYPSEIFSAWSQAVVGLAILIFALAGIWAAGRSTELLGSGDPSAAVVDEVLGQLVTFLFIPFTSSWKILLAGFLLFRLFDIWKPYPIASLENLPFGLGICADDIVAGVYAGIALSIVYAAGFAS